MANISIEPGTLNVTATKGTTWKITQTIRSLETGQLVNLTGYDCNWAMAETYGGTAIASAGTASGLVLGGTAGTITHVVSSTITAGMAIGQYVHQYELIEPDGEKPPHLIGTIKVTGEVVLT